MTIQIMSYPPRSQQKIIRPIVVRPLWLGSHESKLCYILVIVSDLARY
jgi:hypothetical protein